MADLIKSVPIILDKPRALRFDLNAMDLFEDKTGQNALAVGNKLTAKLIHALLWVCLKHDDPAITYEAVGAMVSPSNIVMIEEKLAEAFSSAMPEAETDTKAQESSPQP